jgi:transposase, IS5 family
VVRAAFATPLERIGQLLHQRRHDHGREKIYALHAPEVECIGKGKPRTRFELGCKVSLATNNRVAPGGQFVIGARALPGNPFDGHMLAAQIAQTERITGVLVERAYVDRTAGSWQGKVTLAISATSARSKGRDASFWPGVARSPC